MTTNDIAIDTANTEVSGSPADQLKRILVALLGFFVVLHSAVLLVYYVGYAFWGNQPWIIDAMGYMLTWLFIPTLVLLPLAILSRSKALIAVAAVPVVLFLLTYGRSFLPRGAAAEASPTFTVMTYNVLDLNQEYDAVAQQIIDQNPDILGLHELEAHMVEALEERLGDRYPYRKTEPGRGLYSRYPFDDYATFQLAGDGHWGQQALFTIDGIQVAVLNVHPRTPRVVYEGPLGTPSDFTRDNRDRDIEDLIERVESIEGPLIVMGDMNLSDRQDQYGELGIHLEDVHYERGFGLGFTRTNYPQIGLPMWRIDYIFHTDDMVSLKVNLGDFAGSDHRPVIAQLGFPANQ